MHRPRLQQHTGLPPQYYKAKETSSKQDEEKDGESQKKYTIIGEEKSDVGEPIKAGVSQDGPASDDLPKDVDDDSDDEDDHYSRPLSEYIPDGQFLFLPPAR